MVSKMYSKAIQLNLVKAKPGIRFFLIRWLYIYEKQSISKPITDIASELNLTPKLVREALLYLTKSDYFIKNTISRGKGRPSSTYIISDKLNSLINELPDPTNHVSIIKDVVSAFKVKGETHKLNSLNNTTKLLLTVLVSFADECGVVRGIGMSDIAIYTGMDRDRFHRHLTMLEKSGYLFAYIPGLTGKNLFGSVKGVYFLDLNSTNLRVNTQVSSCLDFNSHPYRMYDSQVPHLFKLILNNRNQRNKEDMCEDIKCEMDELLSLLDLLKMDYNNGIFQHVQLKVEECASFLLSNHWGGIKSGMNLDDLEKRIAPLIEPKNLFSSRVCSNCLNLNEESEDTETTNQSPLVCQTNTKKAYIALVKFIRSSVYQLASQVKVVMRSVPENKYREMNHSIIPIKFNSKDGTSSFFRVISSVKGDIEAMLPSQVVIFTLLQKKISQDSLQFKLNKNGEEVIVNESLIGPSY